MAYPPSDGLLRFRPVRLGVALLLLALLVALLDLNVVGWGQRGRFELFFAAVYAVVAALFVWLWRRLGQRSKLKVERFNELLAMTPAQFEEAVAHLLQDMGYRDVRKQGGPGDLAADIVCRDRKRRKVIVQCKRYAPGARVGSRDIQAFMGMISVHHGADRGIFVTTSEFTEPATELAHQHDIELLDGPRLRELIDRRRGPKRPAAPDERRATD